MLEKSTFKKLEHIGIFLSGFAIFVSVLIFIQAIVKTIGLVDYNNEIGDQISQNEILGTLLTKGTYLPISFFYLFSISIFVLGIISIIFKHRNIYLILPFVLIIFYVFYYFIVFSEIYIDDLRNANSGLGIEINRYLNKYSGYDIFLLIVTFFYIIFYSIYYLFFASYFDENDEIEIKRLEKYKKANEKKGEL